MKPSPPITKISDLGFERILAPGSSGSVSISPQCIFRVERVFIRECFGVTLDEVRIGNQGQADINYPVSTLFYSVPSNPKTLDRIQRLLSESAMYEPDIASLQFAWDTKTDPDSILGLPVRWDTASVGNLISLFLTNKSSEPVRVFGVLRGTSAF
jgi:hypothetical protein